MEAIYKPARNFIDTIMRDLEINREFLRKEVTWKTTRVDEIVIFEISERIKILLENELTNHKPANQESIHFNFKNDSVWEAVVKAGGSESYYLARMLYMALARMKSGTVDIVNTNCNIIEWYARIAALKVNDSAFGLVIKAAIDEEGNYCVVIPIRGITHKISGGNVDFICRDIGLQIRKILKP